MSNTSPVPLIIHGPGGVGKDTVINLLGTRRLVSVTDREPRPGERDGHDYYFVHSDIFRALRESRAFVEYAPVLDYWKGILRQVVDDALVSGADFVIRTDIQGARTWRSRMAGCVTVRLLGLDPALPIEEHRADLVRRLNERGAARAEMKLRLDELEAEYRTTDDDYTVVNPWGASSEAVAHLLRIVDAERVNTLRPAPAILRG